MTTLPTSIQMQMVVGRILGTIAFMKDMRDLGKTPDYIRLETTLISHYEDYMELRHLIMEGKNG